uniref:Uncharacterized protein n=1 Tax=Hemiselmis andersenii TaxID=464988 RepID=A0A7S1EBX9_HEMAN
MQQPAHLAASPLCAYTHLPESSAIPSVSSPRPPAVYQLLLTPKNLLDLTVLGLKVSPWAARAWVMGSDEVLAEGRILPASSLSPSEKKWMLAESMVFFWSPAFAA